MYTRSVQIKGLNRIFTFPDFLLAIANTATWSTPIQFYIHETKHILTVDVTVDVWGENRGTVDDFCDTFLGEVARRPNYDGLFWGESCYKDHIGRWIQCERRALGLNPFS